MNTPHPLDLWSAKQDPAVGEAELADLAGCSRVQLWRIRNGRSSPSRKLARRLQEITGIDAASLIMWEPCETAS